VFNRVDIEEQLRRHRQKTRGHEDHLISEANRILRQDQFSEDKVLQNLKQYNKSFEIVDEEDVDSEFVFTTQEIKHVAIIYRLKFLESKFFKPEIPYEAILKIKDLNRRYGKELKIFRILASPDTFTGKNQQSQCSLFAKTNYDNYFLLHRWGKPLRWRRKLLYWPLRSFETLMFSVLLYTFILTMSLPTFLITLDAKSQYWSGYRAAAFFHLLIFDCGVTVYFAFAFALNFSSSVWNKLKDFD
jgi:hypothetical protein